MVETVSKVIFGIIIVLSLTAAVIKGYYIEEVGEPIFIVLMVLIGVLTFILMILTINIDRKITKLEIFGVISVLVTVGVLIGIAIVTGYPDFAVFSLGILLSLVLLVIAVTKLFGGKEGIEGIKQIFRSSKQDELELQKLAQSVDSLNKRARIQESLAKARYNEKLSKLKLECVTKSLDTDKLTEGGKALCEVVNQEPLQALGNTINNSGGYLIDF